MSTHNPTAKVELKRVDIPNLRTRNVTSALHSSMPLTIPSGADIEHVRTLGACVLRGAHCVLTGLIEDPGVADADTLYLLRIATELGAMCFDAMDVPVTQGER